MDTFTAVLLEPDRAVALELGTSGSIAGTGRGVSLREALDALSPASGKIVVADARGAPVGAAVGVVDLISAQSACRALTLAGCSVAETITINDHRSTEARILALVSAKPEIILLVGGTTDGDIHHLEELSDVVDRAGELLEQALGYPPVVLFAGNPEAFPVVEENLGQGRFQSVDNVRPACERERLEPAVTWAASLAPRFPVPEAAEIRPAGAARSMAVRDLAALFTEDVLLLWEDGRGSEAISMLDGHWNRVCVPGGTLEEAVALHRTQARELSGVSLMREISDAFTKHTPGRDLLDVAAPGILVGAGGSFDGMSGLEAAHRLIDLARPRGVFRLLRGSGDALTLLGLTTLLGERIQPESYHQVLEDLAFAVSLDGPGAPIRVTIGDDTTVVEEGDLVAIPIPVDSEAHFDALSGSTFGEDHGKRLDVGLPPLPAGLLVDARGTPVAPERRVRILPRR